MAKRELTDERIQVRRSYVELGITDFTELGKIHSVDRRTIARWAEQDRWEAQRSEVLVTPQEIAQQIKRILIKLVSDVNEKVQNGLPVAPESIDRMLEYVESIEKLDKKFDERGNGIKFADRFLTFCRKHPKAKEILPLLKEVLPDFTRDLNKD